MGQVGRAVTPLSCSELCPHPRGQDMAQRLGAGLGAKLMCARTALRLQTDTGQPCSDALVRHSCRLLSLSASSKRDAYLFEPLQADRCSYL